MFNKQLCVKPICDSNGQRVTKAPLKNIVPYIIPTFYNQITYNNTYLHSWHSSKAWHLRTKSKKSFWKPSLINYSLKLHTNVTTRCFFEIRAVGRTCARRGGPRVTEQCSHPIHHGDTLYCTGPNMGCALPININYVSSFNFLSNKNNWIVNSTFKNGCWWN